jgi:ATP-dependent helicase/nuclease subunit A
MSAPVQTEQQIRDGASSQQHEAANAGAGKTHVLVGRIIRLMLDGVAPERILCLTYTRAAAAEMSTRLFEALSEWIARPDEELISEIHRTIGHAEFRREKLDLARRLFTRALETPGGLKVQTIHAFCERLLQRFPVEAGIMPGFSVLDETAGRELLEEARNYTSEMTFDRLLLELLGKRKGLLDSFGSDNAFSQLHDGLNARLGLTDSDTADDIRQDFLSSLDWSALDHAADALSASASTTDQSQAARIKEASNAASHEDRFAALQSVLLKADGDPKASKSLMTKKVGDAHPDIRPMLEDLQQSCLDACQQIRALAVRDATEALVAVALQVTRRFTSLKQRASAYDYADLIERTNELLTGSNQAAWVLYKLDQGLDHILIDEAQDTSLEQWRIINALTDEFFAGEGARDISGRTIFAVGDRKQSIYSFQGADPEVFDRQRDHYKQAVNGAHGKFISVELQTSFRSSCKVLEAVDLVFAHDDTKDGVTSTDQPDAHSGARARQPDGSHRARAEGPAGAGGRRRPAAPAGAHHRPGPDGAGPLRHPARGRPDAGEPAQEPAAGPR